MPLARVNNPYVRNLTINPSNVYAVSPYRPYAGIFKSAFNMSSQQYAQNFIRAVSPYSVSDPNVIEAIRNKYNIIDNGVYQRASNIGAGIGTVVGVGVSAALYTDTIVKLGSALLATGTGTSMTPVGWGLLAAGTTLAIAGTIMTSRELGRVVGASVGSKEGSIAMTNYLKNLGNSMVNRPITTFMTAATLFGANFVLKRTPLKNPFVRQGINMVAMRLVNPIAARMDDEIFGKLDDEEQLTYTNLISLQGDLADNFSGTSLVKAGAISAIKGKDEAIAQIAKMYGRHEKGFDALDFNDVREAWGVDIGTFGNGLIDMLGEILVDTDNNVNIVKNRYNRTIAKGVAEDIKTSILADENSVLFKRYFEKINGKIVEKDAYKNEFGNKKIERMIESYLEKYKDPSLAKDEAQFKKISTQNAIELLIANKELHAYLLKDGLPNIKDNLKESVAREISLGIQAKILDSLKLYSPEMNKYSKIKKDYALSVKQLVDAQKEAYKKVNEGFKNNAYNFDKALAKELETHNFEIHRHKAISMLKLQPALRSYSISNDNVMRAVGYFTRPTQSLLANPKIWKRIKTVLKHTIRKADPFKKETTLDDLIFGSNDYNAPITKDQYDEIKKKVETFNKELQDVKKKQEQKEFREILQDDAVFSKTVDALNKILEEFEYDKMTAEEQVKLAEENERVKLAFKEFETAKKEAQKKFEAENLWYKKRNQKIKKINKHYEDMKLKEDETKERVKAQSIEFENPDGTKQRILIETPEDVKLVKEKLELILKQPKMSGSDITNVENMRMGLLYYKLQKEFEGQTKDVISTYNKIINMLQMFSVTFENDYALFNFLISETHILKPEMGKRVRIHKEIAAEGEVNKDLQKPKYNSAMEELKRRFLNQLVTVSDEMKDEKIFQKEGELFANMRANEVFKKFKADYQSKKPIAFDKYLATDVFTEIKNLKDNNDIHFNNNPELFKQIDDSLNDKEILVKLDFLDSFLENTPRGIGKRFRKGVDLENVRAFRDLKTLLTEKLEKILSDHKMQKDFELLKGKGIHELAIKMIITRSFMSKKPGMEGRAIKTFSQMSANDLKEYIFKLTMETSEEFGKGAQEIDNMLRTIQVQMNILKDGFAKDGDGTYNLIEKEVVSWMQQKMSKIKENNIIKAISAKYLKRGDKNLWYHINYQSTDEFIRFSEEQVKAIDELILTLPVTEDIRVQLKEAFVKMIESGTAQQKEALKAFGILEDIIKNVINETGKEEIEIEQKTYDFNETNKYVVDTKDKIVDIIKEANGDMDVKEIQALETKITNKLQELILRYYEYRTKETNKQEFARREQMMIKDKIIGTVLYKSLAEGPYGAFFKPEDFRKILRGKHSVPNTKIDLEHSPYRDSLLKFLQENNPSLKTILQLKSLPFGFFKTYKGAIVDFQKITQLDLSLLPDNWKSAIFGPIDEKMPQEVIEFLRYIPPKDDTEFRDRVIHDSFNLPHKLRKHFENNPLSKDQFLEPEFIKDIPDSIAKDLYEELVKLQGSNKKVFISDALDVSNNKIRVIRIDLGNKEFADFYIPEQVEKNIYDIKRIDKNGEIQTNRYVRQPIAGEKNQRDYLINVINKIGKDIKSSYSNHKKFEKNKLKDEKKPFIPYEAQNEIFLIFNKQRFLEDENQFISDFVYYNKKRHGDYTKFILQNRERLTQYDKALIENDHELFLNKLENDGFSKDVVQSDPKSVLKKININGKLVSILDIMNPLAYRTRIANRSAHGIQALANSIIKGTEEEPMIQSNYAGDHPEYRFKTGYNMKTLLLDVTDKEITKLLGGKTTYEDAALISESAARAYFKDSENLTNGSIDGYKINDRHSGKYSFFVISDEQMKTITKKDGIELVISKSSVESRGLQNVKDELALTNGRTKDDIQYLTREQAEANAIAAKDTDEGFLYMSLTDDLSSKDFTGYKAANDDSGDGAKMSTEEWPMFSALSKIFPDIKGMDQLFEYWYGKGKGLFTDEDIKNEIYGNEQALLGKRGKLRKVIEKAMPNSAYGKIMPDMTLERDQIKIPGKMAFDMGIADRVIINKQVTYVLKTDEGADQLLLHRYPHQGRRSFAHLNVVLDTDPEAKTIRINPWMTSPQNADFDGDGAAIFSYKGASKDILTKSKIAFSHDYSKQLPSDMPKEVAEKISTSRSYEEVTQPKQLKYKKDKKFKLSDKDFNNVILRQAVLKRYSAYLKDVFDSQAYAYDLIEKNQKWFDEIFLNSNVNKDENGKPIYKNFYALITDLYDFYSQTTFDFSKHGTQAKADVFKLIHDSLKNIQKETFEGNINRTVEILKLDKRLTDELDKVKYGTEKEQAQAQKIYVDEITKGIQKINERYQVLIEQKDGEPIEMSKETSEQELKIEDQVKETTNEPKIISIDKFLNEEINKIIEDETGGFAKPIDDLLDLDSFSSKSLELKSSFLEPKDTFKTNEFTIDGRTVPQIFKRMADIEKRSDKSKIKNPFREKIDQTLREFAASVVKRLGVTPGELKNIRLVFMTKNNERLSFRFDQLFKLKDGDEMFYFSPDRATASHFRQVRVNIFTEANIKEFFVEDSDGIYSDALRTPTQNLYTGLGKMIVNFLNDTGYSDSMRIHPLLHNKLIYQTGVLDDLYLGLKGGQSNSNLIKILNSIDDKEALAQLKEILNPFFAFQTVAQYVEGDKRTNMFKSIYQIEGIFENKNEEYVDLDMAQMKEALINAGLLDKAEKMPLMEDFIAFIEKQFDMKFQNDEAITYLNKLLRTLIEINDGLPEKYNTRSQFLNEMTSRDKINLLVKLQDIRDKGIENLDLGDYAKYQITMDDLKNNTAEFSKEIGTEQFTKIYNIIDEVRVRTEKTPDFSDETKDTIYQALRKEKEVINLTDVIFKKINQRLQTKRFSYASEMNYQDKDGEYILRGLLKLDNTKENYFIRAKTKKNSTVLNMELELNKYIYETFGILTDSPIGKDIKKSSKNIKPGQDNTLSLYISSARTIDEYIKFLEDEITFKKITMPISKKKMDLFLKFNIMKRALGIENPMFPHEFLNTMKELKQSHMFDEKSNMRSFYKLFYNEYMRELHESRDPKDAARIKEIEEAIKGMLSVYENNQNLKTFNMVPEDFIKVFFGNILFKEQVYDEKSYDINKKKTLYEISEDIKSRYAKILNENLDAKERFAEKIDYNLVESIINEKNITVDYIKDIFDLDSDNIAQKVFDRIMEKVTAYRESEKNLLPEDMKQIDTHSLFLTENFGANIKSFGLYNAINQLSGGKYVDKQVLIEEAKNRILASNYQGKVNPVMHSALIDAEITLMAIEKILATDLKQFPVEESTQAFIKDFKNKKRRINYVVFDTENIVSKRTYNRIYEISYITFDKDGNEMHNQYFLKNELDERTIRWLQSEGFTEENIKYILDQQKGVSDFEHNKKIFEKVLEDFKGKTMIGQAIKSNAYGEGDIQKLNYEKSRLYKNEITKIVTEETFKQESGINKLEELSFKELIEKNLKMDTAKGYDLVLRMVMSKLQDDLHDRILLGPDDNMSKNEKKIYIERTKAVMDAFMRYDNGADIYKIIQKNKLLGNMDEEYFQMLYGAYKQALEKLITKKLGIPIPEIVRDDEYDRYIIKWDRENGDSIKSIEYDENDIYANVMYKSAAFYEALNFVKEAIRINEVTYGKYEFLKNVETDKPLDEMYFEDTVFKDVDMVAYKKELDRYASEGNELGYLTTYYKMVKRQEALKGKTEGYVDRYITDLAVNKEDLKKMSEETTKVLANTPMWRIISILKQEYDDYYDRLHPDKTDEQKDFSAQLKVIVNRLQIQGSNITQEQFSDLIGINPHDNVARAFYNDFLNHKERLIKDGIPVTLKGDKEEISKVPYTFENEALFIQAAFYSTVFDKTNFYDIILRNDQDIKFATDEAKEAEKQRRIEEVFPKRYKQRVENAYNKEQFAKAREQIFKWILDEDWDSLKAYLDKKPKGSKDLSFDEIKAEFYKLYEELKLNGIKRVKQEAHFDPNSDKMIELFKETGEVVAFIPGNKTYERKFKEKVYHQMYEIISNNVLYVDSHITSLDTKNPLQKPLTFNWYKANLEHYDGKYINDDLKSRTELDLQINKAYDFVTSRSNKIDDLSKYQIPFNDMIDYFKSLGEIDYKMLYNELVYGELGRVYRVTIITDISEKEKAFIRNKIDRGNRTALNRKYSPEELGKLRTGHPEYEDEKSIFSESTIDFMGMMRDTAHPTLKVFEFSNNEKEGIRELKELIEMNKTGQLHLGFTTVTDLFNTDKISYEGYRLPKPIAWVQSTIVQTQKALMLMNTGFVFRNLVDGFQRNYQAIVNSSNPWDETRNFIHEGIRSWDLLFKYKNQSKIHLDELSELKVMLDDFKAIEQGLNTSVLALDNTKQVALQSLSKKIASLESYLKNVIADEKQTLTDRASSNYTELSSLVTHFKNLAEELNNAKDKDAVKTVIQDFVLTYIRSGFFKQMIMNTGHNKSKLNFEVTSPQDVETVKDNIELLKFINEVEKSNIISDQYEIGVRREVRDIYKHIDELITDVTKEVTLADRINNFMSGKWNILRTATDYIEHTQRIHGILLDIHHNGKFKDTAFANSLERFFNYGMKSAEEISAGVYFPFMSFAVRNLDFYMKILGDQKYVRFMTNLAQGVATWYNEDDEEDDYRRSNFFSDFTENQGWFPMGRNFGVKIGNSMFDALQFTQDPIGSFAQKLNPMIQQINNLATNGEFNYKRVPVGTIYDRASKTIRNIATNNVRTPADVMPSLFYNYSQYTPYKYRTQYTSDFRNIYRDLFFPDGTRRVPSRNAFTNAKNIRYQTYRNARLMGVRK